MSGLMLKIIALLCMTLDHMAQFLPDIPYSFHYIGRVAAPVFIFLCIEAINHTHNIKIYILRMYVFNLFMGFIQLWLGIDNNIFRLLFAIAIICTLSERKKYVWAYCCYQLCSFLLLIAVGISGIIEEKYLLTIVPAALGSVFNMEGGLIYLGLALLFYVCKDNKKKLSIMFVVYSMLLFVIFTSPVLNIISRVMSCLGIYDIYELVCMCLIGILPSFSWENFWQMHYQVFMILSLPLITAYNGKRGNYSSCFKYFFYLYYPVHLIALYYMAELLL